MSKKKRAPTGNRYSISPEKFVEIWSKADSVDAVIKETKMPKNAVYSRVTSYRTKGIQLKVMKRPSRRMNIAALNEIVNTITKPKAK